MKQFDVFAHDDQTGLVGVAVLSGQAYLTLPNIVVVPLYSEDFPAALPQINPDLGFQSRGLIAVVDEIASVSATFLSDYLGRLDEVDQLRIKNALDRLIAGY